MAMKVGTGTKVTIGVLGILAAGLIGFLVTTHRTDSAKEKGRLTYAGIEQDGLDVTEKASEVFAHQHSDEQDVADKDEREAWDAVMKMLDEIEKSTSVDAGGAQSENSGTLLSETEDDEMAISPELVEAFTVYSRFTSLIRALEDEYRHVNTEYATLKYRYIEIMSSLGDIAIKEERQKSREEAQRIYKRMQDLKPITDQYDEQREPLLEKREDIFRQRYGMSSEEFMSRFREEYRAWRASL